MGHAATVALSEAKLLQLDHRQSSGLLTNPRRAGFMWRHA